MTTVMLLVAAVLAGLGVFFLRSGGRHTASGEEFLQTGVRTQGRVVEVRERLHPSPTRDTSTSMLFHPVVEFALSDGRTVRAETLVGARPAPARVGQTVAIVHAAADPTRVMLADGMARPGAIGGYHRVVGSLLLAGSGLTLLLLVVARFVLRLPV